MRVNTYQIASPYTKHTTCKLKYVEYVKGKTMSFKINQSVK